MALCADSGKTEKLEITEAESVQRTTFSLGLSVEPSAHHVKQNYSDGSDAELDGEMNMHGAEWLDHPPGPDSIARSQAILHACQDGSPRVAILHTGGSLGLCGLAQRLPDEF